VRPNKSVTRNIKRFPEDFMFQLSSDEFSNLMSQIATSSWAGTRKPPYAFTKQGAAIMSGFLNSDVAIEVYIGIIHVLVAMRQLHGSAGTFKKRQRIK